VVQRWTLQDPATAESWTFQFNPNQMTSVHAPKSLTIFSNAPVYNPATEPRAGMGRVFQRSDEPYEWSFSGVIREQEHHDDLIYWTRKTGKLVITDHFGRQFTIRLLALDLNERRPTARRAWRFEYTVKALMYGQITYPLIGTASFSGDGVFSATAPEADIDLTGSGTLDATGTPL
jgi:hypothetical protein